MNDNGLSNVMSLIKKQKWENLFKRRELMHTASCKEFYANLTVFIYKKKEIARSRVRGVEIEFDNMNLALILNVLGHTGVSEYIKEVREESKYIKPLEITRKFANNRLINVARRIQSTEMKPFQRFVHFVVMKNVVPRFGKRDTTSFMDLTYMDHLLSGRKINLPRVMMRHMAYVISVKDHELLYGDWMTMIFYAFDVPLVNKQGEEPKENRRRDDEIEAPVEEVHEEGEAQNVDFDWEAVIDKVAVQGESGSDDQFFDAQVDVEELVTEAPAAPTFLASPEDSTNQQKKQTPAGVDPSGLSSHIPESVMIKLQAEFERARANKIQLDLEKAQAENARLLALLQQAQSKPKP
ncbi:hypothetical protein Dimus_032023 [Dionaea muscipula]